MSVLAEIRVAVADMLRDSSLDGQINILSHVVGDMPLPHVVIVPAEGKYIDYHGTFGPTCNMTIRLVARVVYPIGGSAESGDIALDGFLSSGTTETLSVVDALAGDGVLPDGRAFTLHAADVDNHLYGQLGTESTVSAEIPLLVQIYRS